MRLLGIFTKKMRDNFFIFIFNYKTINKQHLELKVSYQNTRGNINYTYTQPYAKPTEGTFPPDISNISTKVVESKAKDFLNLSFVAFSVGYSF